MEKKLLVISILCILLILTVVGFRYRMQNSQTYAESTIQQSNNVNVDAFIGEYHFTLYGYTSPQSLVTIDGMGIYDQTYSDSKGYFEFRNRFSPLSPREACLSAIDQFGRVSSPVCIPPFPTKYDIHMGPIILSPTISLNSPQNGNGYYIGDEVILSGQTIPNTEVNLSTFIDENHSIVQNIANALTPIHPAYAYTFPQLTTRSDDKGNFAISLPSSTTDFFRIMAQTNYDGQSSPESIKLSINIYPVWMMIVKFFIFLFGLIANRLLELTILTELIILTVYFLRRYLQPHTVARNRALALYRMSMPVKEDVSIIPYRSILPVREEKDPSNQTGKRSASRYFPGHKDW